MADFVQTMKDWYRMCRVYANEDTDTSCVGCPLLEFSFDKRGCDAIYSDFADNANWAYLENIVAEWANEHPEPVYEVWFEYLLRIGVIPENAPADGVYQWIVESIKHKHIPADIAQKLGIEPKEV